MGCDDCLACKVCHWLGFNSRTPVGCDLLPSVSQHRTQVSIHAPQWGATRVVALAYSYTSVSIHAPQWGATRSRKPRPIVIVGFNSRTPVGCDFTSLKSPVLKFSFQFTHPSGVRQVVNLMLHDQKMFQFTHPSGVRQVVNLMLHDQKMFQFTPPSGVRPL